jgi:hypothetical protein
MTRRSLAALATVLLASHPLAAQAQAKRKPAPAASAFRVELEQDGQPVPIKDHEAVLRRAPFALILTLPDKDGVFEPELYETARSGRAFGRADLRGGIAGAEAEANKSRDITIRTPSDPVIHFWDCDAGQYQRFDQLTPGGGGCRGRRSIDSFYLGESVPIGKILRRPLHVVFFRGSLGTGGVEKEVGRDWLKLYLDTVPDSLKAGVRSYLDASLDTTKATADRVSALQSLAALGPEAIVAMDALGHETAVKAREAAAVADLRAILAAQSAYASANGGFYDGLGCLIDPRSCRPRFAGEAFLERTAIEARNGYTKLIIPGTKASKDEIKRAKASDSSLKDFVLVAWPETFGETGYRAFCADAGGRICFVEGASPPAKNGRCDPACKPLE